MDRLERLVAGASVRDAGGERLTPLMRGSRWGPAAVRALPPQSLSRSASMRAKALETLEKSCPAVDGGAQFARMTHLLEHAAPSCAVGPSRDDSTEAWIRSVRI